MSEDEPDLSTCRDRASAGLADETLSLEQANRSLQRELEHLLRLDGVVRASEAEWRTLVETMPQIVWITRPDGWHTHFNHQWMEFTGLTLEESIGFGWNPPFHPDDRERAAELWEEATTSGEPYEIEYRLRRADGTYHWMLGRAMPLRNDTGEIVKWFGTCTDIEELKQAQAQIIEQARLLDQTQDAILVHDLDHRILYWNQGAERIHGWTASEAVGRNLETLVCPDIAQADAAVRVLLRDGEWTGEVQLVDRQGREVLMEGRWSLLRADDGTPRAALAVNTDVTERRRMEAHLLHALEVKATHDPLTSLPNRSLLRDRLESALARLSVRSGGVVLLLCDLDDFKIVNDALGHLAGDQVLCEIARRLRSAVRDRDLVARLGGDEFAILLEGVDEQAVQALTDRLLEIVPSPILLDTGQPVEVGISVGVVTSTIHHDADTLLRDADATLYHAKGRGKRRVERFDSRLHVDALERLALPQELRAGLEREKLICLHQPEVDVRTGRLFAMESLVRWDHPDRGLLAPGRFVPLAETVGMSGPLFERVLAVTLEAQQRWATRVGFRPAVSVNLSARQLDDQHLPGTVAMALTRWQVPAESLWLEVTETAIANVGTLSTLRSLHEMGIHLAIDDFGTGWSSLNRLSEFPFDMLKIDRSFVARLAPGSKTEHMVRATIVMAHALGMLAVAEGVETAEQLELLASLECDIVQGFLLAKPLDPREAMCDVGEGGTWTGPGRRDGWAATPSHDTPRSSHPKATPHH